MIPKVATSLFHHTTRAVAAVQNATGQSLLTVLQSQPGNAGSLGPWTGATSSSGWGGSAGGAKFNTGGKFYSGYTGTGRAVTQTNPTSATTNTNAQDDDELPIAWKLTPTTPRQPTSAPRTRRRSSSLSLVSQGRAERGESLGVLQTVQMHVRLRHTFGPQETLVTEQEASSETATPRPVIVRRNSTSATQRPRDDVPPELTSAPSPPSPRLPHSTDPAAPQTTAPPSEQDLSDFDPFYYDIKVALNTRDNEKVVDIVRRMRSSSEATFRSYNMALEALHFTRPAGQGLNFLLETYNEMLARGMIPNLRTYTVLMLALTDRDREVHKVITMLTTRVKRRILGGRDVVASQTADEARVEDLRKEVNFNSAMALFRVAVTLKNHQSLDVTIYGALLKSAALHGDVDAAITVFAHLEKRKDIKPVYTHYAQLISVYGAAGDLDGCKEVFSEFKRKADVLAATETPVDRLPENSMDPLGDGNRSGSARVAQLNVWNRMIEAYFRNNESAGAVAVLEEMLASKAGEQFKATDVPRPASSTFTIIISGFCRMDDTKSALKWFDMLLSQPDAPRNPYLSTNQPTRPDAVCWNVMLDKLGSAGETAELNRLYEVFLHRSRADGLAFRQLDRMMVLDVNIQELNDFKLSPEIAEERVNFLVEKVLQIGTREQNPGLHHGFYESLVGICVHYNLHEQALLIAEAHCAWEEKRIAHMENIKAVDGDQIFRMRRTLGGWVAHMSVSLFENAEGRMPSFDIAMRVGVLSLRLLGDPAFPFCTFYLKAYQTAKASGALTGRQLPTEYWDVITLSAAMYTSSDQSLAPAGFEFPTMQEFAMDLVQDVPDFNTVSARTRARFVQALALELGPEQEKLEAFFEGFPPSYNQYMQKTGKLVLRRETTHIVENDQLASAVPVDTTTDGRSMKIDMYHSRFVEEFYPHNLKVTPLMGYERFVIGLETGCYPAPEAIARLIGALGRLGEMEKVQHLYSVGQEVLRVLDSDKKWQSTGWFYIEDQMIVAFVHAGQMDAALIHRERILSQGGTPSADSYGALIQGVKDTTDDPVYALELFNESQSRGNPPNLYLYNNIISKLAKARKADMALQLFEQMKGEGIRPSSITYGTVIAACCRVGDTQSAELLFLEMSSQKNFRARVPPYNTMMQLYTQTKPNRERALYYYNMMRAQGIKPTEHTYKLLLDAFGSIEPVNIPAMEEVFQQLLREKVLTVYGTHWASMINAWGCVQKDLQKARDIFDGIAAHPSTKKSQTQLPDAVAFEAIFNVFTLHRRADLLTEYRRRLAASSVHMTAYIANLLIKGYAACDDLNEARAIFESLLDPATGRAAPNNHAPHDSAAAPIVPATEPVYREPSTWEAMVRAELGSGHRDEAIRLLERMRHRNFPPAVVQRISGIMVDDSVAPWPTASSAHTDSGYGSPKSDAS